MWYIFNVKWMIKCNYQTPHQAGKKEVICSILLALLKEGKLTSNHLASFVLPPGLKWIQIAVISYANKPLKKYTLQKWGCFTVLLCPLLLTQHKLSLLMHLHVWNVHSCTIKHLWSLQTMSHVQASDSSWNKWLFKCLFKVHRRQ